MYVRAFLDLALGLKVDAKSNTVRIEPRLPEAARAGCPKMEFDVAVPSAKGRIAVSIDHEKGTVSADMGRLPAKPRLASSYELG
jgi:hypothetical protein